MTLRTLVDDVRDLGRGRNVLDDDDRLDEERPDADHVLEVEPEDDRDRRRRFAPRVRRRG